MARAFFRPSSQKLGRSLTKINAAVIVLANLLLAVVMLIVAQRSKPGREMELASEVRNSALPASEMDAQVLQQQLAEFRDEVRGVREAVVGFVRHPLATVQRGLVVPLAGAVINGLKKPV
jgi:hypothetical protein